MRGSENVKTFREKLKERYDEDPAGYVFANVFDSKFKSFHNLNKQIDDIAGSDGIQTCYELPPHLKAIAKLPESAGGKNDANHGLGAEWTKVILHLAGLEKHPYAYTYNAQKFKKKYVLPRLIWVKKDWTLNQIHKEVFMCIRWLFSEWADYKDPESKRKDKSD
jgi:hypothetical protein